MNNTSKPKNSSPRCLLTALAFTVGTTMSWAQTLTFPTSADTYIDASLPTANDGAGNDLKVDGSPVQDILLKFVASGIGTYTVQAAKLRLYCTNSSNAGGVMRTTTSTAWSETSVTWNDAPAASPAIIATLAAVAPGNWYEVDVTAAVTGDGTVSLRIASTSTDGAWYGSKERTGGLGPQLVVTLGTAIPPPTTILPLEVIGPDGYIVATTFQIADPTGINTLSIEANHLGYTEGLSPLTGAAKASVRMNNGPWVNLTNSTPGILIASPEVAYGGIGGGYDTVRLNIPVTNVIAGANIIAFRFNGTDGATSGYRILSLNLFRGAQAVLPPGTFGEENPALWTPPRPGAADIAAGQALWSQQNILKVPGSTTPITASCGMCHDKNGRDLKYFNFSNWSIIQRSLAHGLTQTQSEQIASYIRALSTPAPAAARPWEPPYQPGPGLDNVPASEWAAGAGLASVLDHDWDMLPTMLPPGTNLDSITATNSTLNLRTQKVAVQFPDWNSWLPTIHPADIWTSGATAFVTGEANTAYNTLRTALPAQLPPNAGKPTASLPVTIGNLDDGARNYISKGRTDTTGGGNWRTLVGTTVDAVPAGIGIEKAKLYLAKWMGVKHWEVMHEFNMEGLAAAALPPSAQGVRGEARGWPSDGQSVWANAPHMTATNLKNFAGQSKVTGIYLSSVWYQLQMTLNPGMRQLVDTKPVDWDYHMRHMNLLREYSGEPQALRYEQTMIKAYQMRDNGSGPNIFGWQLRFLHPSKLYSDENDSTAFFDDLDTYDPVNRPNLRRDLLTSQLNSFMRLVTSSSKFALTGSPSWPRRALPLVVDLATHDYWYALEPVNYTPVAYPGAGEVFVRPDYIHADSFYRFIPRLQALQVPAATIVNMNNWRKAAWPLGAWDARYPDYITPTVALTAPANNATLSGTNTISATAGDNVEMGMVQFKVDGFNVGAADSASPYSIQWNTATVSNGPHLLTAVARDAAGNITTSALRTVTTSNASAPTYYQGWLNANFTAAERANAAMSGDLADPDGDGLVNRLEYALGLAPKTSDTSGAIPGALLGGYFTLTFAKQKGATDVTVIPEVSSDMSVWQSGPAFIEQTIAAEDAITQTIRARDLTPAGPAGKRFLRLKVTRP